MKSRFTLGVLSLTLLLASCGQQTNTASTSAPNDSAVARPAALAPLLGTANPNAIAGQYIVVMSEGSLGSGLSVQNAGSLIRSLNLDPQGVSIQQVYRQAISGFAAKLSAQNIATLRADPRVKYIEQDQTMYASATQTGATWGIDRIDQRSLPLDGSYTYDSAAGVTAYILDTGINVNHVAFGGRATWGINETGDGNNTDCQGHGTHVAGTVGSSTWGVAKDVKLVAIKVLNCQGSGSNSGILAGMDWAAANGTGRKVLNMSLGPRSRSTSTAFTDAVNKLYNQDIITVVAAGNSNDDACYYSPADAPNAITVGASMSTDRMPDSTNWGTGPDGIANGSNYGTCVDIVAPGDNITSALNTNNTGSQSMGGTSMASPHVAGAVALLMAKYPSYTAAQITSTLIANATTGKLTNLRGTPNRLLYTAPSGSGTTPPPTGTTTTYTGTVSSKTSSYKPSSTGFSYAGGTLKGNLSGPSGTDFDLYLSKWNGSAWTDVASSTGSSSSESISYNAASGTYRWEVYAYNGSGNYTLVETK